MRLAKSLLIASAISGLISTSSFANADLVAKGEKIFKTKKLGNCVACHAVNGKADIDAMGPGSFGPKLSGLSYWDDKTLYDTVYDVYAARGIKVSPMPAFGRNGWLDDAEIKAVVAYLKTIN
ncbi:MAG: sulfur oxidation c-type cytochrome SoxX [Arcobacteraceae bacterium]|nr:sulfur oxidation c-type cytochrome SoxX [Arcobacteraceae bacterium]